MVKIKYFLCLVILLVCVGNTTVQAAGLTEVDSRLQISTGQTWVSSAVNAANKAVGRATSKKIMSYNATTGLVVFSNRNYSTLDSDKKKLFMETMLGSIQKASATAKNKNALYNFVEEQDTSITKAIKYIQTDASADFESAGSVFRPFGSTIGIVLGVIAICIFVFMGMSVVFDIAYLVLPPFKALVERGETHKRPVGVSKEAWATSKEVESGDTKKNVMSVYVSKRVPVMIIMAICLGYVISGKIYDVMTYIVNAFTF